MVAFFIHKNSVVFRRRGCILQFHKVVCVLMDCILILRSVKVILYSLTASKIDLIITKTVTTPSKNVQPLDNFKGRGD